MVCNDEIALLFRRFAGDNPEARAAMTAMHPIGRIGAPEEIADAVIWLSSPKSSLETVPSARRSGASTPAMRESTPYL